MGWHRWLMKHGIGSPGYIARRMARHYRAAKEARPFWSEREVLNAVYAMRVAAQSVLGGPVEYKKTKEDFSLKTAVLDENPDLFSIIRHAIIVEHPELQNPYAPPDRFEILDNVISEILDQETPGWRNVAAKSVPSPGRTPSSTALPPRFSLTEEERLQVGITYFVAGRRFDASARHWRPVPRASLYSECEAEDCVLTAVKRMHESGVPRRELLKHFFLPIQLLLMAQRRDDFLTIQQEPAFSCAGKSNFADLYDAYAYGSGGEAGFHQEWTRIQAGFGESTEESAEIVTFSGGSGLTKETALRIDPVPDRKLAHRREAEPMVMGEYWYLAYTYGRMGIDWFRESQILLKRDETGRMYDCLNVKFKDGDQRDIYFDVGHLPY
jgi:hypothetical protein